MNRIISFTSGIFTVLNTIQLFVFDMNQTVWIRYMLRFSLFWEVQSKTVNWILAQEVFISIFLSSITLSTSAFFLYCLHTKSYVGLAVYSGWIVIYELLSFSLGMLAKGIIKNQFKELVYLKFTFQILRMLLHFLALPFILRYMLSLYQEAKTQVRVARYCYSSGSMTQGRSMLRTGPVYQHRLP
ncbi:putative transmembrane protein 217B [Sorex fumeus]|uniref:putative transmembrane protein 217B n=1 Tax=Sorex fumeus TaxID=62283 RepID=UPI0024AE872F|nr:putative transmembrane protein 217B [Sorex fumeus]